MAKEIIKENGKTKCKLIIEKHDTQLLTMRNGFQWSGQPMNPELAEMVISVLMEYLDHVDTEEM